MNGTSRKRSWGFAALFVIFSIVLAASFGVMFFGAENVANTAAETQTKEDWVSFHGTTNIEYANGALNVTSNTNPGSIVFTGGKFANYEMEVEMKLSESPWFGIMYRANGVQKGFYQIGTSYRQLKRHETKSSGSGWDEVNIIKANSGYSAYTLGTSVKIRLVLQNNALTLQTMVDGSDTEYFTEFENISIPSELGTGAGYIGFCFQYSKASIYSVSIKDLDSSFTYTSDFETRSETVAEWGSMRGEFTVTEGENVTTLAPNENPAVYGITNIKFTDYVLETEYDFNANWSGVCYRVNGVYKAFYSTYPAKQVLTFHEQLANNGDGWGYDYNQTIATKSTFSYGDRVRLKVTVKDNKLTVQVMAVGKDSDYLTTVDNVDISTLYAGNLSTSGYVGLVTRKGVNMNVYSFTVTDSVTGKAYTLPKAEESTAEAETFTNAVTFDGNTGVVADQLLSRTPETVEVWFKTSSTAQQVILGDYWNGNKTINGFYLKLLEGGKLQLFESNSDSSSSSAASNLKISTSGTYADGKWYKAVSRRNYDEDSGLVTLWLSVYENGELVESVSASFEITQKKLNFYNKSGKEFFSQNQLYIGTDRNPQYIFEGEIAEIRMWDYRLTEKELATSHKALSGTETGLLYNFIAGENNTFTETVYADGEASLTAKTYEVWLSNYILGDADFRIAVLPDIQWPTEKFEIALREYFTWIRDHAEALNIKLVISVGDLVNTCTPEQFATVSEAASILDGYLPFMPVMGNHDYPVYDRDAVLFNEYFPYEKYSALDCFGGAYETGSMENYYYLLTINGEDYLFLALELSVRPAVAEWANGVLSAYPDRKVIVINHAYQDPAGGLLDSEEDYPYNAAYFKKDGMEAGELWDTLISKHENVVMTISGHMDAPALACETFVGDHGNKIQSLFFDASSVEQIYGDAGMLGILGFHDGSNTVNVNYYSVDQEAYLFSYNQFTVELDGEQEYRIVFEGANGTVLYDKTLAKGTAIVAPAQPGNYSDGVFDYTFTGWEGFSAGLTATQNYTFVATYSKTPAAGLQALSEAEIASGIATAKTVLFGGDAEAYVKVAENADGITSVTAEKTYLSEDQISVFEKYVKAFYTEEDGLYVHLLVIGTADSLTAEGQSQTAILPVPKAFGSGSTEITLPSDLARSRYDYLLGAYGVSVYGDSEIALTTSQEAGKNVIVCEDGVYTLVSVTEALKRNVARYSIEGKTYRTQLKLIEPDTVSTAKLNVSLLPETTVDGDLSDWSETVLSAGRTLVGLKQTAHKNVTFYAYLTAEGLYVAARAEHDLYQNQAYDWFNNTNFEIYVNGSSLRLWVTANPACANASMQGAIRTVENTEGNSNYISVAEGFVPMKELPYNALSGELTIGFAWKTPGDMLIYYNSATNGHDWWYLTRRHASTLIEQYFVNSFGICEYSSVPYVDNIKIDGDLSDFRADALRNYLEVYGTGDNAQIGYTVYAQYFKGHGVYVGLQATHSSNPTDNRTWYNNTNFEFYIGENRYYITNAGAAVGNGLFGKNIFYGEQYDEVAQVWNTTIELFIPDSSLGTVTYSDYIRMGFSFKVPGENVLVGNRVESDWWYLNGYLPSDTANQFYVYEGGISTTQAVAINTPVTCVDVQQLQLTSPNTGSTFVIERIPENREALHEYGKWTQTAAPNCTAAGEERRDCLYCDAYETQPISATGVHEYGKWTQTVAPGCAAAGEERRDCLHCDAYETQPISATGAHEYGEWTQTVAPGCTEAGEERRDCLHCDAYETRSVPATGHGNGEWKTVLEPTEDADGREDLVCEHCGDILDSRAIPVLTSGGCGSSVTAGLMLPLITAIGAGLCIRKKKGRK